MTKKQRPPIKHCSMCVGNTAIQGEKYCKKCKEQVLRQLRDSGYLTDTNERSGRTEAYGRKSIDTKVIGGSAEFGSDGDE